MKNMGAVIVVLFLLISAVILSFIPPVQQLGSWIRLIIFHGNLSVASLYLFYIAGLFGLVAYVLKHHELARWSKELGLLSVVIWFVGTLLSLVSMQVAWGGLLWTEPRTISALTITMVGAGKEYLLRGNNAQSRTFALTNTIFAAAVLVMRSTLTFVMHPDNPIGTSDSLAIRLFPMLLLAMTLGTVFFFAHWRLKQEKR